MNQTMPEHKSVLVDKVIEALDLTNKAHSQDKVKVIDATLGTAGHALEFLKFPVVLLGIDTDKKMLEIAETKLKAARPVANKLVDNSFKLVHGNFKDIAKIAKEYGFYNTDCILFDLGTNTLHFKDQSRGFSFLNTEAELDMRLDQETGVKASDLLNALREDQLFDMFSKIMDYTHSRSLSKAVVERKIKRPFYTVGDFLDVIQKSIAYRDRRQSTTHWATLPFLALRIATNSELENLYEGLEGALEILKVNGRCALISFHSTEDAIAKNFIKVKEKAGLVKSLYKDPVVPEKIEVELNPSSRSAKLRAFGKL